MKGSLAPYYEGNDFLCLWAKSLASVGAVQVALTYLWPTRESLVPWPRRPRAASSHGGREDLCNINLSKVA